MLVLTRKPGEQIVIGNTIRITVVSVGHGRVKIGVEAPANVPIDRQEVFERKRSESTDALVLSPADADAVSPTAILHHTTILRNRAADPVPADPAEAAVDRSGERHP